MASFKNEFQRVQIQLEYIKSATNNFDVTHYIGGLFGSVYKGELLQSEGLTMVALKHLDRNFGQGDGEFYKEIMMLSQYIHENINSLLGFCDESDEIILVYEYAFYISLGKHISRPYLSWNRRLRICIGAARGLSFLHYPGDGTLNESYTDVKSANILLNQNWNAKVADFLLSKFGPANQQYTFLISDAVDTIGYCDPLYVETGLLNVNKRTRRLFLRCGVVRSSLWKTLH